MKNVLTCTKYAFLTFLNYFRSLLIDGLEKIFRQSNLQGQLYSATIFDNYLTHGGDCGRLGYELCSSPSRAATLTIEHELPLSFLLQNFKLENRKTIVWPEGIDATTTTL